MAFIIAKDGTKLMPSTNRKKIRKLLRSKKAKIVKYNPFTIQLLYETTNFVQPMEIGVDTGYIYIGISVKSQKHEYVSEERTLLADEKERIQAANKLRRSRRNRLRHRKARFDNRRIPEGWLAPSLRNKVDRHIDMINQFISVAPINRVTLEIGQFNMKTLDNAHYDTLREAVFARDNYTCQCCGRTIKDGAILRVHHIGFRNKDRSNRHDNLLTVCTLCHTPSNHNEGGKLWNLKPKLKTLKSAAFMNSVKYDIRNKVKALGINTQTTYGVDTKRERLNRNIDKSHANDAYCIGGFRPKHRKRTEYFIKKRRNNRILEKFFDAKYIDKRDGKIKKGSELSCNRTSRAVKRNNENNLRIFRLCKVKKGKRIIRRNHYDLRPGDEVLYKNQKVKVKAVNGGGKNVKLSNNVNTTLKNVRLIRHTGGWERVTN